MRIECDKCHAKYSIADDKVRGKTFKIRCKKCANVIVVRDKAAAADATPVDEPLGWHIALGGETVGPLTDLEIRRRYDAGEIDRDTSVWQEGFDDWVPLGSVETFADLPVRAIASEAPMRDEVISTRASQSPRVTDLTGQRNENSVLFSLENLQKLAGGSAEVAAPATSRFTPSTTAPSSEGSGLIDIRQMRTMMGPGDEPTGTRRREDDALPSFSGGGFGGLSAQPLVTEEPTMPSGMASAADVATLNRQGGSRSVLLAAGILGVAIVAAAAIFANKEPPPPPVIAQAPAVAKVEPAPKKEEPEVEKEPPPTDSAAEEGERAGDAGSDKGTTPRSGARKTSTRSGGSKNEAKPSGTPGTTSKGDADDPLKDIMDSKPSGGDAKPSGDSKAATGGSPSKGKADIDVDCLLDPSLAKCKTSSGSSGNDKPSSSTGSSGGGSKVDPNLPESLTPAAIKSGIESVKGAAERCGQKNGAAAGSKVAIKFQVNGSTGTVSSAEPLAENASTPLGRCVAGEAKKAKFPKFQKASQGFEFRFKM